MIFSIKYKLFLTMLAVACLLAVTMFGFVRWSFDRGFLQFVNTMEQNRLDALAADLTQVFAATGTWERLQGQPRRWHELLRQSRYNREAQARGEGRPAEVGRGLSGGEGWEGDPGGRFGRERRNPEVRDNRPPAGGQPLPRDSFELRLQLLDARQHLVIGPAQLQGTPRIRELVWQGQTVGLLRLQPQRRLADRHQLAFAQNQQRAFAVIALIMAGLAALLSLPLSRQLVGRLQGVAAATKDLAQGRYETRIAPGSRDELGQLADHVNRLALILEENQHARRQWVADISHELRTPLAILRGELEAIQDGIRLATPAAIASLHGETLRLGRLVDDLYQLSLADVGALTYRKQQVDVAALLASAVAAARPRFEEQNLGLEERLPPGATELTADPDRLQQLFDNLLNNALRYTDPGGRVQLQLSREQGRITLDCLDSAPGVAPADMGKLFDRLFRVEGSRSRATGGAGLGLAICKNIVEAHAGTIEALPSPLGGLWVRIRLPQGGGH